MPEPLLPASGGMTVRAGGKEGRKGVLVMHSGLVEEEEREGGGDGRSRPAVACCALSCLFRVRVGGGEQVKGVLCVRACVCVCMRERGGRTRQRERAREAWRPSCHTCLFLSRSALDIFTKRALPLACVTTKSSPRSANRAVSTIADRTYMHNQIPGPRAVPRGQPGRPAE